YTVPFAKRFAAGLQKLCSPSSTVAFLCCPTTFVAFQNGNTEKIQTYLLEVDRRFEVLAPKQYVYYDLDEPDNFPDFLKGSIDLAVVDPPFLNDRTNRKILQTLKKILHPKNGRLILLTSTSIESELDDIYTEPPVGPLYKTSLAVQHGQLANSFACWGSFPGVQAFDEEDP
ncbi:putative N6-adenine methyltransferase-domain-containing protein, partial [Mycena floridula]